MFQLAPVTGADKMHMFLCFIATMGDWFLE